MLQGCQTWTFENEPVILSTGVVGGPFEKNSRLAMDFDKFHDDLWMGQDSYEKAQRVIMEDAVQIALRKKALTEDAVQFFLAGDLINQITPTTFAARTNQIPHIGLFSACAVSAQGLALAALIINQGSANHILTGAASHNASAEKQFRYPTEYGGQKPPTAQWTVTGAGVGLVGTGKSITGPYPRITSATIGKVVDMGLSDPFNMGGAMAPAAVDTIQRHFFDLKRDPDYYDLIITGDLAEIGRNTALELLESKGLNVEKEKFQDCGLLLYKKDQEVFAGGSGPGCSATVLYGHLLNQMKAGTYKRILIVATGSLLSPLTFQQKETIPCIAHAVAIEYKE
ncbi:stage V sporulation protein AD [Lederbergia lenta]|uniref:Stage V sporulation protein AD n=1 Tax=Lederbergia lenta TaxID=1467 RepID=A0A2X4WCT3_LEDLE|nr:stage V sporulation protein AD [Lederbergia lenta]MCM3110432.1 stage V sporulation protein AD [Lederbergia lenta]MEC2324002.1 stage V sporulation protein AD [Lederbergia lenta]SQI60853.1 stage V sporulation protein AD [Lederbergia lenta]